MIAKISNGSGFKGLLQYVLSENKNPEILAQNGVFYSGNSTLISKQFQSVAQLSDSSEKPVWHATLSFAKEDEPLLDNEKINKVAQDYLEKMKIKDNQFMIVKHNDTLHQHIHIVINRVGYNGKTLRDNMSMKRSMDASMELEEEYELTKAKNKTRTFWEQKQRDYVYGFKPDKQILRGNLRQIIKEAKEKEFKTVAAFNAYLKEFKIGIEKSTNAKNKEEYDTFKYSYTYFNNTKKQEETHDVALKMSSILKGLSLKSIKADIDFNKGAREIGVASCYKNLKELTSKYKITELNEREVFSLMYYNDINIKKAYFKEAILKLKKKDRKYLATIYDSRQDFMVREGALKKSIYKGDIDGISFSKDMLFNFNKIDLTHFPQEKIDKFYTSYFKHLDIKVPPLLNSLIKNNLLNNSTTNYILSNLSDGEKKLPYDNQSVDFKKVSIFSNLLNITEKMELPKDTISIERKATLNAYRNVKEFTDDPVALAKYLAKRGIEVKKVNGNFELFGTKGEKLGLNTALYIKEFKKYGTNGSQLLTEEKLKSIYEEYHISEKVDNYRRLDNREIKALNITVKRGEKFELDKFDSQFMEKGLAKKLNANFKKQAYRSTLKYEEKSYKFKR